MKKYIFGLLLLTLSLAFNARLNAQQISIIGSATPSNDWETDHAMIETFAGSGVWTIQLYLTAEECKFRQDMQWMDNWGGTSFPNGVAVHLSADNFGVDQAGWYYISFNRTSLAYSFTFLADPSGNIGMGTDEPAASALLDLSSTDKGFLPPRMTTAERDAIVAPVAGLMVYNIDDSCLDTYTGESWLKNCGTDDNKVADFVSLGEQWTQKADFGGTARYWGVAFTLDGKAYVGLGDEGTSYKEDFWSYDPDTDSWTQIADFGGTARSAVVAFTLNGKAYVGLGSDGSGVKSDFWSYDPDTDSWTQIADFGGTARSAAVAFTLNGKGYVGLGASSAGKRKDFWSYDPDTDSWMQIADFGGTARGQAVAFTLEGKGYVGFGYDVGGVKKDFWSYELDTDSWTQLADFGGSARLDPVVFILDGKAYVGLGWDGSVKSDFWSYDPDTDSWTQVADFRGTARTNALAFALDGKGYVGLGWDGAKKKDFWSYDPNAQIPREQGPQEVGLVLSSIDTVTVCESASLTKNNFPGGARAGAVSVVLNGTAYAGTGYGSSFYKDFWAYQPTTDSWIQKADFGGIGRVGAVAFDLEGKVYIGLGNSSGTFKKDFWRYDPDTDSWTQIADFGGFGRHFATAFTVGDKAYVGLGSGSTGRLLDFWRYDPDMDSWTQLADFDGGARYFATAFTLDGKAFVGLGDSNFGYENDMWQYDHLSDSWIQLPSFGGVERRSAVAFEINGHIYMGLGLSTGDVYQDDIWEYDPTLFTWSQKDDFGGGARRDAIAFSIDNEAYVALGKDAIPLDLDDLWTYCPGIKEAQYNYTSSEVNIPVGTGSLGLVNYGNWTLDVPGGHLFNSNTGNVGIGTQVPGSIISGSKLDVVGGHIAVSNDFGVFSMNSTGDGIGAGFDSKANDDLEIYAGGQNGLTLSASGDLTLEVGEAYKPGGGSWVASSDRRLKKNIIDYRDGLKKVLQIRPVRFNYNKLSGNNTEKDYIGVIAQELQEITPYMVGNFQINGEEYMNVDNSAMVYLLINAVKELHEKNENLKNILDQLEAQNQEMKADLDLIKSSLNMRVEK